MRDSSRARSDASDSMSAPPASAVETFAVETNPMIGVITPRITPTAAFPAAAATTASTSMLPDSAAGMMNSAVDW